MGSHMVAVKHIDLEVDAGNDALAQLTEMVSSFRCSRPSRVYNAKL